MEKPMPTVRNPKRVPFLRAELNKLSPELKPLGEQMRKQYEAFEAVSTMLLQHLELLQSGSYRQFVKNDLINSFQSANLGIAETVASGPTNSKKYWKFGSRKMALEEISLGHYCFEAASDLLLLGNLTSFTHFCFMAGLTMGRVGLMCGLCEDQAFQNLYLIGDGQHKSSAAGKKSGQVRRQQSLVPAPENLRIIRQKLLDSGKPPREISAMLAKKYYCTPHTQGIETRLNLVLYGTEAASVRE